MKQSNGILHTGKRDEFLIQPLLSKVNNIYGMYKNRTEYTKNYGWHLPSIELVKLIKRNGPIVSVGCGKAYTEHFALKKGADIIATDFSIKNIQKKWIY